MPICTYPQCWAEGEYQPDDQFNGHKYCQTCRQRLVAIKQGKHGDSDPRAGKNAKKEHLDIGTPPQFASDADRQRWQKWLRDLISS